MPETCQDCGHSVEFGSGRFVNRVPSDDGWTCAECMASECDKCGETIPLDEDYTDEDTGDRLCDRCIDRVLHERLERDGCFTYRDHEFSLSNVTTSVNNQIKWIIQCAGPHGWRAGFFPHNPTSIGQARSDLDLRIGLAEIEAMDRAIRLSKESTQ